jgi:plasmid stabilization system protein ParE
MDVLFGRAAARLSEFPRSGVDGLVAATRELIPHSSYRLVYEIRAGTVWIVALIHTARQWPPVAD